MQTDLPATYLQPTPESGRAFVLRRIAGEVVMLNLLTSAGMLRCWCVKAAWKSFMAFASDAAYLEGMGHRVAALEDSRLLPLAESRR